MDMRFVTWNVRSLYRAGSFMTFEKEISEYKLDIMGVQEVRLDRGGTKLAGKYTFYYIKGNKNYCINLV
jgi:exonuclease III